MSTPLRRHVLSLLGVVLLATSQAMAQGGPDQYQTPGPDYGVALTPAVYFVNFLFMYFSNPDNAANMPAYRAPIPSELASCLLLHPEGCRYADYQQYFNGQTQCGDGNRSTCRWELLCQLDPSFTRLAPPEFGHSDQINEPLGIGQATTLALSLGMDEEMVLTSDQYQCLIGTPGQRSAAQDTIVECIGDLTNSNGNADIPLSSYGLSLLDDPAQPSESLVRSVCAPNAACLRMNQVIAESLEGLAQTCGFNDKLARLLVKTPLPRFSFLGFVCQSSSIKSSNQACMAETVQEK
jgi:hypothetical protein